MELENPADRAEVAANEARIVIEEVAPRLEGGRFAAKAIVHRASRIHARIFADGHDKLAAEEPDVLGGPVTPTSWRIMCGWRRTSTPTPR